MRRRTPRLRPEEATTKRPTRTATKKADIIAGAKAAVKKAVSTRTKRELIQDAMTPLPLTASAYDGTRLGKVVGKGVQNLKKDRARAGVLKVLKAATPFKTSILSYAMGKDFIKGDQRARPPKEKKEPRKQARIRRGP